MPSLGINGSAQMPDDTLGQKAVIALLSVAQIIQLILIVLLTQGSLATEWWLAVALTGPVGSAKLCWKSVRCNFIAFWGSVASALVTLVALNQYLLS